VFVFRNDFFIPFLLSAGFFRIPDPYPGFNCNRKGGIVFFFLLLSYLQILKWLCSELLTVYCNRYFFYRELEVASAEHQEIQKKWEVHKRQLQETHNEARKVR
jgi:hypothetical protein